jgi:putative Ca2+/H+ antiporter (TMEM165/GDT1 family)
MLDLAAVFATVFITVFIAEFGDKTQLATLLFATDRNTHPLVVFLAASAALIAASALSVTVGSVAGRALETIPVKLIAGIGFVAIGLWSIVEHFRGG